MNTLRIALAMSRNRAVAFEDFHISPEPGNPRGIGSSGCDGAATQPTRTWKGRDSTTVCDCRGFAIPKALALIGLLAALPTAAAEYYGQRPADDRWPTLQQEGPAPAADLKAANYYLILDGSGSMRDKDCGGGRSKIEVAKEAVLQFAQRVPANANLGLFAFDANGPSERVPLAVGNRDRYAEAVNAIKAYENTPLFTSIQTGYRQLTAQAQRQRGYGEYHLVVVTDGRSTDKDPMPMVQQILRESPVLVETIGFCIREKHSLNQPGLTFYQSANDPESLRRSLEAVLAEAPDFNSAQFKP